MPLCPFATVRLLTGRAAGPGIRATQIVVHTMEATLAATDTRFRRPDAAGRSHFGVGHDGTIVQWIDTAGPAGVAHLAAHRSDGTGAVSVTTEGYGTQTWTAAQLDALVRLHVWLMRTHPAVGRRLCRSSTDPGLGHHVLFGSPGPWTPHVSDCPGPGRITQWRHVVIPRVLAPFGVSTDDMRTPDEAAAAVIEEIVAPVPAPSAQPSETGTGGQPAARSASCAAPAEPAGPSPAGAPEAPSRPAALPAAPPTKQPAVPPTTRPALPAAPPGPAASRTRHVLKTVWSAVRDFFLPDSAASRNT